MTLSYGQRTHRLTPAAADPKRNTDLIDQLLDKCSPKDDRTQTEVNVNGTQHMSELYVPIFLERA